MTDSPTGKSRQSRRTLQVPEATVIDKSVAAARAAGAAGLGLALPVVGDVVSTIFEQVFPTAYQRRCADWRADVTASLNELADHKIDLEALKANDTFIDLVVDATTIAIRTSSEEKRRSLRNGIINAGLPGPPNAAKQRLFLRLVDQLDELHLQLLRFFDSPSEFLRAQDESLPKHNGPTGMAYDPRTSNASLKSVLDLAFPQYSSEQKFLSMIISEIKGRDLITSQELFVHCHERSRFTTPLGQEFLRFVLYPNSGELKGNGTLQD